MGLMSYYLDEILNNLSKQKNYFQRLSEQRPPGTLQARNYKGNTQFVQSTRDHDTNKYKRVGLTKDERMLQAFVNGDYALSALKIIENDEQVIKKALSKLIQLEPSTIRRFMPSVYKRVPDKYYKSVISGLFSEEDSDLSEYQKKWAYQSYPMSSYKPQERDKETSKGLFVRSKSEALFCEKLYEYNIPFRYEQAIQIGKYQLAPDFTFLDRNCEEFYSEYCGLMDDPDYVDHYIWKRSLYERAGIYQWDRMIYVYEKGNCISVSNIDRIIRSEILPRIGRDLR